MTYVDNFKPMALVLLIGIATALRACTAQAAGTETLTVAAQAVARAQSDLGRDARVRQLWGNAAPFAGG